MAHNAAAEAVRGADHLDASIHVLAENAWEEVREANPDKEYSVDYARGFEAGYSSFLEKGGHGNPPPVPPSCYWLAEYKTPDGYRAIGDWFAGYQHGASVAQASGLRPYVTVPTSLAQTDSSHSIPLPANNGPEGSTTNPDDLPIPRKVPAADTPKPKAEVEGPQFPKEADVSHWSACSRASLSVETPNAIGRPDGRSPAERPWPVQPCTYAQADTRTGPPAVANTPPRLTQRVEDSRPAQQVLPPDSLAEALCAAAAGNQKELRQPSLEALEQVRPDLYPLVVTLLVDKDLNNAQQAARTLAALKERGRPAAPVLVRFIEDHLSFGEPLCCESIQQSIVALGEVRSADAISLKALCRLVETNEKQFMERYAPLAAEALGKIAEANPAVRKKILPILSCLAAQSQVADQRRVQAIGAIGRFGPDAKDTVELLRTLRLDSSVSVRTAATEALAKIEHNAP